MKAKAPTSATQPGPVRKLAGKKARRRFRKRKAPAGSGTRGSQPAGAAALAGRPPTAPEDFSHNWKALQELLKQKSPVPEKHLISQMDGKKHPQVIQQNRKETLEKSKGGQEIAQGAVTSAPKRERKILALPTKTYETEPKKEAKKRKNGGTSSQQGDVKQRWKAEEAPSVPTEEDIWFDDVDPKDIEAAIGPEAAKLVRKRLGQRESSVSLVKEQAFSGLTKALALDCEMVGVGPKGEESIVARVSIVNQYGKCVYDKYVKPTEPVTDYRTAVSGIRPESLKQGEEFEVVKREVAETLKGRVLVGHALHNDLKVLFLDHPKKKIRDTQKYKPFKKQVKSGRPSLKTLSEKILGIKVQQAEHCSVQDAQAAMRLYIMVKREWESIAGDRRPPATPGHCKEHA